MPVRMQLLLALGSHAKRNHALVLCVSFEDNHVLIINFHRSVTHFVTNIITNFCFVRKFIS